MKSKRGRPRNKELNGTPVSKIRSWLASFFRSELKEDLESASQAVRQEKTKENRDEYLRLKAEDERLKQIEDEWNE